MREFLENVFACGSGRVPKLLEIAAMEEFTPLLRILKKTPAEKLNVVDDEGNTALHI
eukprot:Awhi_evm1s9047